MRLVTSLYIPKGANWRCNVLVECLFHWYEGFSLQICRVLPEELARELDDSTVLSACLKI
jgi:hypothetical protein